MKLQLALDTCGVDGALDILSGVHDLIDIAEVGTPMVMRDGMRAVRAVKDAHPAMPILADLKIVDAGEHEARIGFDAGADIVTVLGVSADATIGGVVRAARACRKTVMADMITIEGAVDRAVELVGLGVDLVCVHTAYDLKSAGPKRLDGIEALTRAVGRDRTAVAGGIDASRIGRLLEYDPAVVVVGGAITSSTDSRRAAQEIRKVMDGP